MSVIQYVRRYLRRKCNPVELLGQLCGSRAVFRSMIHVGAHEGQERDFYEEQGYRDVVWIEGSPTVYARLAENIAEQNRKHEKSPHPARHRAVCALLTDRDDDEVELLEFCNQGGSSSIFASTENCHKRWPDVFETGRTEKLRTQTLDRLASDMGMPNPDVLVVDVQGAELLVLRGAEQVLSQCKAVVSEISTVPYYDGGALYPEVLEFLAAHGFVPMMMPRRHGDLLFLRRELAERAA